MNRIERPFHRLQVIRFLQALGDVAMRRRHPSPFVSRLLRLIVRGTEIGPDHPGELDRRIRFQPDAFPYAGLLALRGQVHALTRRVVLPDRKSTRLNSSHEWISYA